MFKDRISGFITRHINPEYTESLTNTVYNSTIDKVSELVKSVSDNKIVLHKIEIDDTPVTLLNEVVHEKFDDTLKLVKLDIPVYLMGLAGTGKNVLCKQIAKALNLDFYFTNAVTQEYKLNGFIDAGGVFHETQFYKAFKNGGLFFLDEMDASIPEVLIILNAAIANRYFDFPNGKIEAHPNFRVIAVGNTFGTGANSTYTGRYPLDAASLDRFSVVEVDYSPTIESHVTNGNKELIDFCHAFRTAVAKNGINCTFSYRSLGTITKLERSTPIQDVLKMSLIKGMSQDDLNTIKHSISSKLGTNKYGDALNNMLV